MMHLARIAFCAASLQFAVTGFRVKPSKRQKQDTSRVGASGVVDGLYTFGAPGVSSPALVNPRSSSKCFPGLRIYTTRKRWYGRDVDIVPPLAGISGFRHPWMEGMDIEVDATQYNRKSCSEENTEGPNGNPKISLHGSELYIENSVGISALMSNISRIGLRKSYIQDATEVARKVAEYGWRLAHSALDDGSTSIDGGAQVSHLIQHPTSLECIVTFQGTQSLPDWLANTNAAKREFCGLPESVHAGFRDHLRRMVKTTVWQNEIKPYLPSCSKVYVTGHSLGGAMSTLFTACVASAPQSGIGYTDDYQYMGWTQQTPKRMDYIPY